MYFLLSPGHNLIYLSKSKISIFLVVIFLAKILFLLNILNSSSSDNSIELYYYHFLQLSSKIPTLFFN